MLTRLAVLLILFCSATMISAQEDPARLRVIQMTYADSGAVADVLLDGTPTFSEIAWPFATDYVELSPGEHIVTTMLTSSDVTANGTVALEAGRSYSMVAHGDYAEGITFTLIDESAAPLDETGGAAIIVNLTGLPITDIRLDDRSVIAHIPPGGHNSLSLPAAPFTIAGQLGELDYVEESTPLSNALVLLVVRTTPDGDVQMIYQRSSHLTMAEYLKAILPGTLFASVAEALDPDAVDAILSDDGAFTVFLPTNEALERVGPLPTGAALLSSHVATESLPPTVLSSHATMPMLDGRSAQLAFSDTSSGYWEIDGAAILWEIRLANGVIYAIDGVLGTRGE